MIEYEISHAAAKLMTEEVRLNAINPIQDGSLYTTAHPIATPAVKALGIQLKGMQIKLILLAKYK